MRTRWLTPALAAAALSAAAPAAASPPAPFGHACTPQASTLFCPAQNDAQRVASFDGTPIDVDVTLPSTGNGPFPTIALLHGYGGAKTSFESLDPEAGGRGTLQHYDTTWFAQRGYAVMTPSARGFGRSCGKPDSRSADCANGFIHLADQRYEVRDIQTLLGTLVDEGVADPARLAATGESYGGGMAAEMAFLNNRIRTPDGQLRPWSSPQGTPLRLAAAAPIIPWTDLAAALVPNGRWRDNGTPSPTESQAPPGVMLQSYVNALYAVGNGSGFVAPAGSAPEADLAGWDARLNQGEPYGPDVAAILAQIYQFHSAISLRGPAAPMLLSSGWTDSLFPVTQSVRAYNLLRPAKKRRSDVSLRLGNFGHSRGANKAGTLLDRNDAVSAFLDSRVKGLPGGPKAGSVTASPTTCPASASEDTTYSATTWARLHPGATVLAGFGPSQRISSTARGGVALGRAFDPIAGSTDPCKAVRVTNPRGDAYFSAVSRGVTLLGVPSVAAHLQTHGANAELSARLWDVDPRRRTQQLVDRGVYRLDPNLNRTVVFGLNGNGWRIARGHVIKLELSAADSPTYRRSNATFAIRVSGVTLRLPSRERGIHRGSFLR